ncbi:S-formylglutathione hydrolase [Neisseria sp. Ec49-e6-T10]|uniref:S-formylglutathione hydrolase n=1 Tax=Neisseria sp. Ec49-e6-T10 TaxID=3140744 RepID=UPI003EB97DD0
MSLKMTSCNKVFGGWHKQYTHYSESLACTMRFAVFLPPQAEHQQVPVLYWLSGLTCNDENFMQKAGAQRIAAQLGIALVAPDTSPRGENIPDDINADYDLGLGAGFYLNATQLPWCKHYHMYDYVVQELPILIEKHLPVSSLRSISGHSMGGHGALVIALRNLNRYRSVSAFSPICNPINSPWGKKAFSNYLGNDLTAWQDYDASELIRKATINIPMLIDQGSEDNFLTEQLKPECLLEAAKKSNYPVKLQMQEGYDHSYYFISSFIESHLQFHAAYLK